MPTYRMQRHTRIALIESRWYSKSNISMRNLFELIADLAVGNSGSFYYEMAGSSPALANAIPRVARNRDCRYLYIGAHGDSDGLWFDGDDKLSRTQLRNLLVEAEETHGARLDGLYLSSCSFGTKDLATFLFEREIPIDWIAGYQTDVDWIISSALDLLFFNELMNLERKEGATALQKVREAADFLKGHIPELISKLGFGIYVRKRGLGGGVEDILAND